MAFCMGNAVQALGHGTGGPRPSFQPRMGNFKIEAANFPDLYQKIHFGLPPPTFEKKKTLLPTLAPPAKAAVFIT